MDQRKIAKFDTAIAVSGLLAVISMFLPWWRARYEFRHVGIDPVTYKDTETTANWHETVNGWNVPSPRGSIDVTVTGPLVWFPMLALMVLGMYALGRIINAPRWLSGKGFYKVAAIIGFLAVVLVATRLHTYYAPPMPASVDVDYLGAGGAYGTVVGLVCAFAVTVVSLLALTLLVTPTPPQGDQELSKD